jgi:cytochrome c biogenesis protein CcmG, thiol:disulfide interchange protein DsbE
MTSAVNDTRDRRRRMAMALLPVVVFAGLAILFVVGLGQEDPSRVPSVLIGKPAPEFDLPPLEGLTRHGAEVPGFATADLQGADLQGNVTLVNIWASWCGPCRDEHPHLMALSEVEGVRLVGINYKDEPANARRFLGALGLPYEAVGVDAEGRTFVDWGAYGVPETFLVDARGIIRHKYIGPITQRALDETILPMIEDLQQETAQ